MKTNKRLNCFFATLLATAIVFVSGIGLLPVKRVNADEYNPGIVSFVTSLYSDCLGRNPDSLGLNDWCAKLSNGTVTGKQCAYGFFFGSEFQSRANSLTDSELIDAYYRVFLGRSADDGGRDYWSNVIAGTTNDISVMFTGFADSSEFAQKCASCGVIVGDHIDVPETIRTAGSTTVPAAPAPAAPAAPATTSVASAVPSTSSSGQLVWIPNSGHRYHSNSGCSGMINPTQVTVEQAQALGYTPCRRCY